MFTYERRERLAVITLDRSEKRNALHRAGLAALSEAYVEAAKERHIYALATVSAVPGVFSAGGDLAEIYALGQKGLEAAEDFFRTEYRNCWLLDRLPKPHVAIVDGLCMGGGVGISHHGTHRVAGPDFAWSMPECRIGFVPDIGITPTLARMPAGMGAYLGLTGAPVGQADAVALGLATHALDRDGIAQVLKGLADAQPIDPLLAGHAQSGAQGPILARAGLIAETFGQPTVEMIQAALGRVAAEDKDWANDALAAMAEAAPLALKLTLAMVQSGSRLSVHDALLRDFRIGRRLMRGGGFFEGIRARFIDKDHRPMWNPASFAAIAPSMVEGYFAPLGALDVALVDPWSAETVADEADI